MLKRAKLRFLNCEGTSKICFSVRKMGMWITRHLALKFNKRASMITRQHFCVRFRNLYRFLHRNAHTELGLLYFLQPLLVRNITLIPDPFVVYKSQLYCLVNTRMMTTISYRILYEIMLFTRCFFSFLSRSVLFPSYCRHF